ncbi:MAG: nucleotidyltransferase domain-containing protein [Chloroflexota bacterium]
MKRGTLFGSWAAGRATAFSDIDLLVIYSGRTDMMRTTSCATASGSED